MVLLLTWRSAYMPGCSVFVLIKVLALQGFKEFTSKGILSWCTLRQPPPVLL